MGPKLALAKGKPYDVAVGDVLPKQVLTEVQNIAFEAVNSTERDARSRAIRQALVEALRQAAQVEPRRKVPGRDSRIAGSVHFTVVALPSVFVRKHLDLHVFR